jgi:hypothetical protein
MSKKPVDTSRKEPNRGNLATFGNQSLSVSITSRIEILSKGGNDAKRYQVTKPLISVIKPKNGWKCQNCQENDVNYENELCDECNLPENNRWFD